MAMHLIITGKVQGVGYRAAFEMKARTLGLAGWVRNRRDGSVEALIAGEPEQIEQMLAWARRGPPRAVVDAIASTPQDSEERFGGFEVRPTA